MKICFFDSGIGGLTVLRETLKLLPCENYIYYADSENAPYGVQPKETIKTYVFKAVNFLKAENIKLLVVACNTATSVAIDDLRATYDFPIIGIEPAVKPALIDSNSSNKRILVLATPLTLVEEKYQILLNLYDRNHFVDSLPLAELVTFAENFIFESEKVFQYLKNKLSAYNLNNYSTIVLGCTHFPLYKNLIRQLIPSHIKIIDGSVGTTQRIIQVLESNNLISKQKTIGSIKFFNSGKEETDINKLNVYKNIIQFK